MARLIQAAVLGTVAPALDCSVQAQSGLKSDFHLRSALTNLLV